MKLTEEPESVVRPGTHYVYVEKIGDIPTQAPQAWRELMPYFAEIARSKSITGRMSLYKAAAGLYRAGVTVSGKPEQLPHGLEYCFFPGGKYGRFVLTGPYSDLPAASQRVFQIVAEKKITLRDDYCIENYVSDPSTSPAEEQITEILVPTA